MIFAHTTICMYQASITILLFSLLSIPSLQARLFELKPHDASGTLIDDSTKRPVGFVHIFNESKRTGGIANEQGKFKFRANIGDTIVFSALGYFYKVIMVSEAMLLNGADVFLTPRSYEIEAVDIVAFGSYEEFKKKFLALELPKTKADVLRDKLNILARKAALEGVEEGKVRNALSEQPGRAPIIGPTLHYRDEMQRLNYARVLKLEEKQRVIDKKYNREIIFNITQLPEDELTDFMEFCNFGKEYLLHASEYDILVRIEKKFKEYLEMKSRGELLQDKIFDFYFYT